MTRDEWRLCEERFASRGIDMAAVSRGAAFFSTTQQEQIMPDPITRLRAARFDGPQALFTEAVRLLSERPALPDDLAGLVARLREPWFTNGCAAYQHEAADAIEALSAIPLRPEADVRAETWAAAIEAAATLAHRKRGEMDVPEAIRAMITDDAHAALDAVKAEAKDAGMRVGAATEKMRALTEWLSEDEDNGELLMASLDAKTVETLRAILAAIPEVRK